MLCSLPWERYCDFTVFMPLFLLLFYSGFLPPHSIALGASYIYHNLRFYTAILSYTALTFSGLKNATQQVPC